MNSMHVHNEHFRCTAMDLIFSVELDLRIIIILGVVLILICGIEENLLTNKNIY